VAAVSYHERIKAHQVTSSRHKEEEEDWLILSFAWEAHSFSGYHLQAQLGFDHCYKKRIAKGLCSWTSCIWSSQLPVLLVVFFLLVMVAGQYCECEDVLSW
jgi:hypothetical protein